MSVEWTIRIMGIIGQLRLILMDMGHRLMTYSTQLIPKMKSNMLHYESPSMLKYKIEGSSNWIVHKARYLLKFCKWGSKLSGLDCGENSTIKRA
jgi:hypothetical protein